MWARLSGCTEMAMKSLATTPALLWSALLSTLAGCATLHGVYTPAHACCAKLPREISPALVLRIAFLALLRSGCFCHPSHDSLQTSAVAPISLHAFALAGMVELRRRAARAGL